MTTEKYNYDYFPTSEQLSEVLIKCFADHIGNEKEKDLYNESYIKKSFKKFGVSNFRGENTVIVW